MNSDLDRSTERKAQLCVNLTSLLGWKYLQAHNLFLKDTLFKNKLSKVIREITPSADIRRIRRGRKVLQVPRIIPKGKRPLYGIRRLLSVRSDNGTEKEEVITASSTRIADSKSRVIKAPVIMQTKEHLSSVQKDRQPTWEPFNFIESHPATRITSHHFLMNKNTDKNTQDSLYFYLKPSNPFQYQKLYKPKLCKLSHKLIHLNTKAKNAEVENKFSYKKKSVGITRHTPFKYSTRISVFADTHINKKNSSAEKRKPCFLLSCAKRDFRVENEKYRKETVFRVQRKAALCAPRMNKLSLAYSLRRVIQTSFSSIAVHNKKSYRTIFANRGSIPMSWWL